MLPVERPISLSGLLCWACAHIWVACPSVARVTMAAGSAHATALTTTPLEESERYGVQDLKAFLRQRPLCAQEATYQLLIFFSISPLQGPAPLNLEVPPYVFKDETKVLVGTDTL